MDNWIKFPLWVVLATGIVGLPGAQPSSGTADTEREVMAVEQARTAALDRSDVAALDSRVQPAPFDINIFILAVYARRNGHWQQIAWQSTRDPAKSPLK